MSNKEHILTLADTTTTELAIILLDQLKDKLIGEYELHTVYSESRLINNSESSYALVYAFYSYRPNNLTEEEFLYSYINDVRTLTIHLEDYNKTHAKLFDYYYIMPYYETYKGASVLYNNIIIETSNWDGESIVKKCLAKNNI